MSSGQEVGDIFGQDEGYGPSTSLLRSPTVIIASIGLWGMNILLFRHFGIDHVRVLKGGSTSSLGTDPEIDTPEEEEHFTTLDLAAIASISTTTTSESSSSSNEITASKCFLLAALLFVTLNSTTYFYINFLDGSAIGAIFIFYIAFFIVMATPWQSTQWIRNACKVVFHRVLELLNPRCAYVASHEGNTTPRPIPFVDVFFADAMCSLSKVFFDWGMLWHLASHYPDPVPVSVHSILIPSSFAALPYIIRARQCMVMHSVGQFSNDPKRYQHTLNAIKYSTSLFPICLSAYQKTVSDESASELERYLILLLIINSLYSYAWDILMDWGMMQNPTAALTHSCIPSHGSISAKPSSCTGSFLRSRLRFGVSLSTIILVADGIFRFGWMLRFYSATFFSSVDEYILFTELLEVFRRSIWNLLRVEWEHIKQMKASGDKAYADDNECKEEDPFVSVVQMVPASVMMRSASSSTSPNSSVAS